MGWGGAPTVQRRSNVEEDGRGGRRSAPLVQCRPSVGKQLERLCQLEKRRGGGGGGWGGGGGRARIEMGDIWDFAWGCLVLHH